MGLTIDVKEREIARLQEILNQRIIRSESKYRQNEHLFDKIERYVLGVFRQHPERKFTYEDFFELFKSRYPNIPITTVDRRIRHLCQLGFLGRDKDRKGKTRYFLLLAKLDNKTAGGSTR